ncbi:hypothetical protein [Catenulispora subtropica]|uniref:Uncharacterized protein n=1 Tax=Catenulispora subtropica TaxID=450798 RepID=A0ABN2RVS2_9ACTN
MTEMTMDKLTELAAPAEAKAPSVAAQTSNAAARTPNAAAKPAAPSVHRRALLTWMAVYPTITLVQTLLGTHVAAYPLPVRTLVVTALVAPLVVYLVLPTVMKAHAGLLRRLAGRRISG